MATNQPTAKAEAPYQYQPKFSDPVSAFRYLMSINWFKTSKDDSGHLECVLDCFQAINPLMALDHYVGKVFDDWFEGEPSPEDLHPFVMPCSLVADCICYRCNY